MKPGDFLLGVLDFFAILLPGMMATWLAAQYIPAADMRDALSFGIEGLTPPNPWAIAIAFFLASYTLGHFVFMAGSGLDHSYDLWRRRNKPTKLDKVYSAARELHETLNDDLSGGDFTTLKWAKTYVQVHAQQARVEIDRLEADQKFFRSLVVILVALAAHFLLREGAPGAGLIALGLAALSFQRYMSRRWTMTELIYATAVIAHRASQSREPQASAAAVR
jgi:hypothetical protein